MKKHLIQKGKKKTVYKVHVEAFAELDEELAIEADDEDDAINEAEDRAYDMLNDLDISVDVLGKEVIKEPAVYDFELESGEYTVTSAELIDYAIVSNARELRRLLHLDSFDRTKPDDKEYLFKTPGRGVGILNSQMTSIYGALDKEAYILPCISFVPSNTISAQDQKDILNSPKLSLNGKEFYRLEVEPEGKSVFIPSEPIGKSAFRKDVSAADASSYEASDVKKMIDEWKKTIE